MSSETYTVDQHTFIPSLMKYRGNVIDAGARGFSFASAIVELNRSSIYAIDIENLTDVPDGVTFKQVALTNFTGETECYLFGNGTANFIKGINQEPGNSEDRPVQKITVPAITLQDIYNEIGTDIDLLKIDIEGSEYDILMDLQPIPKQITVEFHEHTIKARHDERIDAIMDHLCKYYHCNLYIREWPRYKFMDCLFIRKDLL